ncbi:MAG: hypothetical protein FWG85_05475 [Bacteroidetes bacterium]|nr:hypothetical protein [Bacteroidota bacterium]
MKKICLLILFISLAGVLTNCNSTDDEPLVVQFSVEEIRRNANFYWFNSEYNAYKIDSAILDSIRIFFDSNTQKVAIYCSPGCECGSVYAYFPQFVKVLDSAEISNYEIFVVISYEENLGKLEHPYSYLFNLASVPSIYLLHSDGTYCELVLRATEKKMSIEEAFLDALKFLQGSN